MQARYLRTAIERARRQAKDDRAEYLSAWSFSEAYDNALDNAQYLREFYGSGAPAAYAEAYAAEYVKRYPHIRD